MKESNDKVIRAVTNELFEILLASTNLNPKIIELCRENPSLLARFSGGMNRHTFVFFCFVFLHSLHMFVYGARIQTFKYFCFAPELSLRLDCKASQKSLKGRS